MKRHAKRKEKVENLEEEDNIITNIIFRYYINGLKPNIFFIIGNPLH